MPEGKRTLKHLESHICDKMPPFTLTQGARERFSTKTVDNFVDNLVL
jgi:hypothetical protein